MVMTTSPSETGKDFSVASAEQEWQWYYTWWFILLATNAILGLIAFEWAWCKLLRFRKPIPELENAMPAFRRQDA